MREKSNSVTHLVKIVAREVIAENDIAAKQLVERIRDLEKSIGNLNLKIGTSLHEAIDTVKSTLENAGGIWSRFEDQSLVHEVDMALATIAKNHKRSVGAIRVRINQKELI